LLLITENVYRKSLIIRFIIFPT